MEEKKEWIEKCGSNLSMSESVHAVNTLFRLKDMVYVDRYFFSVRFSSAQPSHVNTHALSSISIALPLLGSRSLSLFVFMIAMRIIWFFSVFAISQSS